MIRLVNELLTDALQGTRGWQIAHPNPVLVQEQTEPYHSDLPATSG